MYEDSPFGEASGRPTPVAVENFYALKDRQTSDTPSGERSLRNRVNLLNWDGNGSPEGLFPDGRDQPRTAPPSPADLNGRGPGTNSTSGSAGRPSVSP